MVKIVYYFCILSDLLTNKNEVQIFNTTLSILYLGIIYLEYFEFSEDLNQFQLFSINSCQLGNLTTRKNEVLGYKS